MSYSRSIKWGWFTGSGGGGGMIVLFMYHDDMIMRVSLSLKLTFQLKKAKTLEKRPAMTIVRYYLAWYTIYTQEALASY